MMTVVVVGVIGVLRNGIVGRRVEELGGGGNNTPTTSTNTNNSKSSCRRLRDSGASQSGARYNGKCRACLRYQSASNEKRYEHMDPESRELLGLCLKRIPAFSNHGSVPNSYGVSNLKLVDANFIWTEPHSKID